LNDIATQLIAQADEQVQAHFNAVFERMGIETAKVEEKGNTRWLVSTDPPGIFACAVIYTDMTGETPKVGLLLWP